MPCIHCQKSDHRELEGITLTPEIPKACWLYANDPRYRAIGDGLPIPEIEETPVPQIDPECVKRRNAPEGPSLIRKAANFAKAVVTHVTAGMPKTPEPEIARRITICEACLPSGDESAPPGFFDPVKRECTHPNCGCNMNRKAAWLTQHCPIGKW
jgi:hypothetical protein